VNGLVDVPVDGRSGCGEGVEDVGGAVAEGAVSGGDVGAAAESDDVDPGVTQGGNDLGPLPVRTPEWSSPSVTSRTQCRQSSIVQCERIQPASSRRSASLWPSEVIAYTVCIEGLV
jgi:hypothetical protein